MLKNKPNIFLSGGGDENDSALLDKFFLESFKGSRILYIPIAMPEHVIPFESCYDWIKTNLPRKTERLLEIDMCVDMGEVSQDALNGYDAVYIGGGNTYKLLDQLISSGFSEKLIRYLRAGGKFYGGSAGAIIAGSDISTVREENDDNYTFEEGLDLLFGHAVICHYDGSQDENIRQFIEKSSGPVIALPEKTGLACSGRVCSVIGYESAFLFKSNLKVEYSPNSVFVL
jgi:dipeptidase E